MAISLVLGPMMAMRIHGGRLAKGESAHVGIAWLLPLSTRFGKSDVTALANSGVADALQRRLFFDEWYDAAVAATVIPLANVLAWFDNRIIDGAIRGIEWGSQSISREVRKLTTGSARDYILMAVVGTLSIAALMWRAAV